MVQRDACHHSFRRRGKASPAHPQANSPCFQGSAGSAPKPYLCPGVSPPTHQDKLSSQSFGTDLPLVDSQVEQHNIFHNEVKAIGPHLAKDKVCMWWSLCGGGWQRGDTLGLTSALDSAHRSRTANSKPSIRSCW